MVQVLKPTQGRSFSSELGAALGGGFNQGVSQGNNFAQQIMLEKARRGLDVKAAQATKTSNLYNPTNVGNQGNNLYNPTNAGKQGNFSDNLNSINQDVILNPSEIDTKANEIVDNAAKQGIPITYTQAQQQLINRNNIIKDFQQTQREYGQIGENALSNVYPEATDEQKSVFKKKGEQLVQSGLSPADTEKNLALEAKKFKNVISDAGRNIPPKRLTTAIKQGLLGKERGLDKELNSLKVAVKPLLDEGFYDTASMILKQKGYYPEEVASVISSLGEGSRRAIAELPNLSEKGIKGSAEAVSEYFGHKLPLNEKKREIFRESLTQALETDPSANLILLRKGYQGKGVDWREFKDAIDDMIIDDGLNLNDFQQNELDILNEPPLDNLDKILYGLKLKGR